MDKIDYPHPVSKLLTQGDCRPTAGKWPNYLELGLTQEHIPELIRMLTDEDLIWAPSDSLEVWAPMHAWRALGQLQTVEGDSIVFTGYYSPNTGLSQALAGMPYEVHQVGDCVKPCGILEAICDASRIGREI